jgi:hypothetical protein
MKRIVREGTKDRKHKAAIVKKVQKTTGLSCSQRYGYRIETHMFF